MIQAPRDALLRRNRSLSEMCDDVITHLDSERNFYLPTYAAIKSYLNPSRGRFFTTPNDARRGTLWDEDILNGEGTLALRTLANGMASGIMNPASVWFLFTVDEDEGATQLPSDQSKWLLHAADVCRQLLAQSNFYNSSTNIFDETASYGTGVLIPSMVHHHRYGMVPRFYPLTTGQYWLGVDDRCLVDSIYREYPATVMQLMQRFGPDGVSPTTLSLYQQGNVYREVMVREARCPNCDWEFVNVNEYPFMVVHYEKNQGRLSENVTYHKSLPGFGVRWDTVGNDAYGIGVGHQALPDITSLQRIEERNAQLFDLTTKPTLMVAHELAAQASSINLIGGNNIFVNKTLAGASKPIEPIYVPSPVSLTECLNKIADYKERINRFFYTDLFRMWAQLQGVQPRNQLEVAERTQENMLQLGPVYQRFQDEYLDPVTMWMLDQAMEHGLVKPMPEGLAQRKIKPHYISMLAHAQKMSGVAAMRQYAAQLRDWSASWEGARDWFDIDMAAKKLANDLDVTQSVVPPDAAVKKLRDARAAALQQEKTQQQMLMQSQMAIAGAKAMSETQIGNGQNLLQGAIGGGM